MGCWKEFATVYRLDMMIIESHRITIVLGHIGRCLEGMLIFPIIFTQYNVVSRLPKLTIRYYLRSTLQYGPLRP